MKTISNYQIFFMKMDLNTDLLRLNLFICIAKIVNIDIYAI